MRAVPVKSSATTATVRWVYRVPSTDGGAVKRCGRLKRRRPMKRCRLKAKGGSRFPARRCPEFREWIRQFPCSVEGCENPSECAHVKSQGAGGDDIGGCVPLCPKHHRHDLHQHGIATFQLRHQLDLAQIAAGFGEAWAQRQNAPALPF